MCVVKTCTNCRDAANASIAAVSGSENGAVPRYVSLFVAVELPPFGAFHPVV